MSDEDKILQEIEALKARSRELNKKKPAGFLLRRMLQECSEPEFIKRKIKESVGDESSE